MIEFMDEMKGSLEIFGRSDQGGRVNMEEVEKDYLNISGRSEDFFTDPNLAQDPELLAALGGGGQPQRNTGSFGKAKLSDGVKSEVTTPARP